MPDSYPEHPVTYRQEIVGPLFKLLWAGESCVVVGAASVAKSNLVRFLLRSDVQKHYLGTEGQSMLMVLVDTNRLADFSEWASYELILHCIVMQSQSLDEDLHITQPLNDLHREVALSRDHLLGQRYVERAVRLLCVDHGLHLVILIDEADRLYRVVDERFLHNLRAVRDDHKYQLSYVLFTRTPLDRLRDPAECEAFYELFSRNVLGLRPYQPTDTGRVISQLEVRKGHSLSDAGRELLIHLTGGHPGLLVAAFDALAQQKIREVPNSPDWFLSVSSVATECHKLWEGLDVDEQWGLIRIAAGFRDQDSNQVQELLVLKGLITQASDKQWRIFSPVFGLFVTQSGEKDIHDFRVDEKTASIWVAGRRITDLTPLEFSLARLLYKHRGQVQARDAILEVLYPEEFEGDRLPDIQDNRVDTVIRRLRSKVEPVPGQPRYILTVRGHGYKLVSGLDSEQT